MQEFEVGTEVQDIALVVLDDRNQLRAAYASQESLFERDLSDTRTVDQLMGQPIERSLFGSLDEITVLRLGELHSILGRNGRSYDTEVLLETRDQLGQTPHLAATNNEIEVKGNLGVDSQHQIAWFGGTSSRFTVSLWFTSQIDSLDGIKQEPQSRSSLRREAERLARRIFSAAHK